MASPSITTQSALLTSAKRPENPYSRQYSTPTSSRKREYSSSESSDMSSPMLPGAKRRKMLLDSSLSGSEGPPDSAVPTKPGKPSGSKVKDDLKCQDCDKIFMAKTILERHQYTAKHGGNDYTFHNLESSVLGVKEILQQKRNNPLYKNFIIALAENPYTLS